MTTTQSHALLTTCLDLIHAYGHTFSVTLTPDGHAGEPPMSYASPWSDSWTAATLDWHNYVRCSNRFSVDPAEVVSCKKTLAALLVTLPET